MVNMALKTKSPVHIGSGNKYSLMDAYVEDGRLIRVNMDSVFRENPELTKEYIRALDEKNLTKIRKILKNGEKRYTIDLKGGIISRLEEKILECVKDSAGDVPYIPGSTVKGYIRTALIVKYLKDNEWNFDISVNGQLKRYDFWNAIQNGVPEINIKALMRDGEDRKPKTFGRRFENLVVFVGNIKINKRRYDAKYDIFKFLLVSDFYPQNYRMHVDTLKIKNVRRTASRILETVEGTFHGEIELDRGILTAVRDRKEYPALREKLKMLGLSYEDLGDMEKAERKMIAHIRWAMREYLQDAIKYEREKLRKSIKYPEESNMRIGFGTGFLYKTLWVYIIKNLPERYASQILRNISRGRGYIHTYPKSLRMLSNDVSLGWCLLEEKK